MVTNRTNADRQRQENGGGYTPFPTLGRVGNRVRNLTGRRGHHRPVSPPHPGRGLLAADRGRGRGPRPISSPNVGKIRNFPQVSGERRLQILIPSSPKICSAHSRKDQSLSSNERMGRSREGEDFQ